MKTLLPFLIVPAVLVGVGLSMQAQEAAKDADKGRTVGTVLLLRSGHAMEGDIVKDGDQYRIRRGKSEVCLAVDSAVRLCADWDEAVAFALTTIKTDSADDRVKLARWCHRHGLTLRALEQVQIALEMQPKHAEAKQMVVLLEQTLNQPAPAPVSQGVKPPGSPTQPPPTVDVSFETLVDFTTKVQPILMNTCASCHSGTGGGKFHLERVANGDQKASTQRNLATVLTYVDLEHPKISPLLVKAVTRHGDGVTPPIRDRSAKPSQAIQQWVEQTIAKNPHLKDYAAKKSGTPAKITNPEPKSVFPTQRSQAPVKVEEVGAKQPEQAPVTPTPRTPADEFDPLIYNAWAHPDRFGQQSVSARR
jgi:hypothetical protein